MIPEAFLYLGRVFLSRRNSSFRSVDLQKQSREPVYKHPRWLKNKPILRFQDSLQISSSNLNSVGRCSEQAVKNQFKILLLAEFVDFHSCPNIPQNLAILSLFTIVLYFWFHYFQEFPVHSLNLRFILVAVHIPPDYFKTLRFESNR